MTPANTGSGCAQTGSSQALQRATVSVRHPRSKARCQEPGSDWVSIMPTPNLGEACTPPEPRYRPGKKEQTEAVMADTQGFLVRGWQVGRGMGFAILTLGVDLQGPNGETGIGPSPNYLLSAEHCRELAGMLLATAETIERESGSA